MTTPNEEDRRAADEPAIVKKRAIDVTPHEHGIWCSIGDGEPFVNPIVLRRWSEDGTEISFMLDSHNFMSAKPDELIAVVETEHCYKGNSELIERCRERDEQDMRKRPSAPTQTQTRLEKAEALLREGAASGCRHPVALHWDCPDTTMSQDRWCWPCRARAHLEEQRK